MEYIETRVAFIISKRYKKICLTTQIWRQNGFDAFRLIAQTKEDVYLLISYIKETVSSLKLTVQSATAYYLVSNRSQQLI